MRTPFTLPATRRLAATPITPVLSALAAAVLLAACGGGADPVATVAGPAASASAPAGAASAPAPATLSGSVATGAPLADARLRIVDADGTVVAQDVPVDAEGRYAAVTLTGSAPWRIEACGWSGGNYQCLHSVAQAAGTANVTPLTGAMLLLASGQTPDTLMTGTAPSLTAGSLAGAQGTLLAALAPVLADAGFAGVSGTLNLVTGTLQAGSRSGYDRVLDAVGVSTGVDAQAFVQIVPRLGSGNLYIEQGSAPVGTLASSNGAAQLPLDGLETLFRDMTLAARSIQACAAGSNGDIGGMARALSVNAQLSMGGPPLTGRAAVATGLCSFLAGGDGEPSRLGARFMSPTLGRCDFSGSAPVCGISFVLQDTDGNVEPISGGMGVVYESGAWKFKGDLLPIAIEASARVQRDRRIDGAEPVDRYARALAFEVPAYPGLACAKVAQRSAEGAAVTLAFFKRHGSGNDIERLSLWTTDGNGNTASPSPTSGSTRSSDDTWLALPEGAAGDTAVRNFFRGGRSVSVSLYADADCTVPYDVAGRSSFDVEVQGVPPVWAQLPSLPWPSLTAGAALGLRTLAVAASASADYAAAWTVGRGSLGVNGLTVCSDRAACGQGGSGRVGEVGLRGAATSASVTVRMGSTQTLEPGSYKMLSIYGRTAEGVGMQSNHMSCPGAAAGTACEQ